MSSRLGFLAAAAILTLLTAIDPAQPAETSIPSRIRDAGKLVFCTELAFPPWEMLDAQTQQPTGFDIDFAAAVAPSVDMFLIAEMSIGTPLANAERSVASQLIACKLVFGNEAFSSLSARVTCLACCGRGRCQLR